MTKPLSERIAKHQKQKSGRNKSVLKTEFIAQIKDITEALNAGWTVKAIWETLRSEEKVSCGYDAFRKYVIKLIKPEKNITKDGQSQQKRSDHELDSFSYNAVSNLEDLI
jgi:transposase